MASTRQRTHIQPARRRPSAGGASALLTLGYAVLVYAAFLAVLGYAIGFFAGAGVPKGIDAGPRSPWPLAVAVDLLLLLLFAVQHTVMARPCFKRRWTRLVPAPAERATFVLGASLLLALLFWLWRPVGGTLWHLRGPAAGALICLYAIGWVVAVGSTFMINHFDLFGLRQAYRHARGAVYRPPPFTERALYQWVRHPLMAGFVIVFWAAPVMTAGHLLFAVAATGYILLGIRFEERDARRDLGEAYRAYQRRVPALMPAVWPRPRRRTPSQGENTA
jgi:protein-S-isoprenylcysteine O-methyltransferase Ste14